MINNKRKEHNLFYKKQDKNLTTICLGCGALCIDYSDINKIKGKCKCKECIYNFKSYKMYNINIAFCYKCGRKILFDRQK